MAWSACWRLWPLLRRREGRRGRRRRGRLRWGRFRRRRRLRSTSRRGFRRSQTSLLRLRMREEAACELGSGDARDAGWEEVLLDFCCRGRGFTPSRGLDRRRCSRLRVRGRRRLGWRCRPRCVRGVPTQRKRAVMRPRSQSGSRVHPGSCIASRCWKLGSLRGRFRGRVRVAPPGVLGNPRYRPGGSVGSRRCQRHTTRRCRPGAACLGDELVGHEVWRHFVKDVGYL